MRLLKKMILPAMFPALLMPGTAKAFGGQHGEAGLDALKRISGGAASLTGMGAAQAAQKWGDNVCGILKSYMKHSPEKVAAARRERLSQSLAFVSLGVGIAMFGEVWRASSATATNGVQCGVLSVAAGAMTAGLVWAGMNRVLGHWLR